MIKDSIILDSNTIAQPFGWREFKVGDIFDVISGGYAKPTPNGKYPIVKAQSTNNGHSSDRSDKYSLTTGLTIGMRGSFNVFLQTQPVALGDNAAGLTLKSTDVKDKERTLLFLAAAITKENYEGRSGYTDYPTITKLSQTDTFTLPIDSEGNPDFVWMSSYVKELEERYKKELEERYKKELEAYLQVTGLSDTTLTNEEQTVLEQWNAYMQGMPTVTTKDFKIKDILNMISTQQNRILDIVRISDVKTKPDGYVDAISATTANNQISFYAMPKSPTDILRNRITSTANGNGKMFFQKTDFMIAQDAYALELKDKTYRENEKVSLFIMSAQAKNMEKYDYTKKSGWARVSEDQITLPVTSDNQPDYHFMETYISAQQKLAIDRLSAFRQKEIDTTEELIQKDPD